MKRRLVFISGFPGCGKSATVRTLAAYVRSQREEARTAAVIEVSDVVRRWVGEGKELETEKESPKLRAMLWAEIASELRKHDVVLVSGVREKYLLREPVSGIPAHKTTVVFLSCPVDERQKRYEREGKTNFLEAEVRARELGTGSLGGKESVRVGTEGASLGEVVQAIIQRIQL